MRYTDALFASRHKIQLNDSLIFYLQFVDHSGSCLYLRCLSEIFNVLFKATIIYPVLYFFLFFFLRFLNQNFSSAGHPKLEAGAAVSQPSYLRQWKRIL
jgi:hypothetical protein